MDIVRLIAERTSKLVGKPEQELYEDATRDLIKIFKDQREHFCARVCEKKARQSVMSQLPTHKNVLKNDEHPISINLKAIRDKEHKIFDGFVSEGNLNELIFRYPIRESNLCGNIVNGLTTTTKSYESAVRKLVLEDERARGVLMGILSNLKDLIDE